MPPAAMDVQSPVASKSSSLQNPNHNTSYDQQERVIKPPIFGNASEFYANDGSASRNGLRTGSAVVGRTRPRMVKLRKHSHHGRSKGMSGEFGLVGSNWFQVGTENDCSSTENGFMSKLYEDCFVFGAISNGSSSSSSISNSNAAVNSNSGERVFDLEVEALSSNSILESRSSVFESEKKNLNENEGKSGSEVYVDKFDNTGFVFGANQKDKIENEGQEVLKEENGKFHNVDFVFGATGNNVKMKPELEKFVSEDSVGKVRLQADSECGKDNFVGFKFGDDRSNSGSNFNIKKGDSSGIFGATYNNASTSVSVSGASFVFGANWFDSNDQKESGVCLQNSASNETGKMKVEGEAAHHRFNTAGVIVDNNRSENWMKGKDKAPYVFGSISKNSSSSGECMTTNCKDELKSGSKTFECKNSMTEADNGTLDSNIDSKCKLSSLQNKCNAANGFAANSEFNLSDEIKKLNIDDFKPVDGADNKKSSANDDPLFVFRSNKMVEASSNGSSGSTFEQNLEGLDVAAKGTVGEQFESSTKNGRSVTCSASLRTSSSGTYIFQVDNAMGSAEGHLSNGQVNNGAQLNGAASLSSFSLFGLESQGNVGVSEAPPIVCNLTKDNGSSSTSTSDGLGVSFTEFTAPKWDPSCLKASLFPELNKKLEFSVKGRSKQDKKSKTTRGKLKQLSQHKQHQEQDHVKNKSSAQEALDSPVCYSPMDYYPYEETTVAEIFSGDTSMASHDCIHLDNNRASSILHSTVVGSLKDGRKLNPDRGDELNPERSVSHSEKCFADDSLAKVFGFEMPCSDRNSELLCTSTGDGVAYAENASACNSESSRQIKFCFASGLEDMDRRKFSFSASSSTPKSISAAKRVHRKKSRRKVASEPFVIATNPNVKDQGDLSNSQTKSGNNSEANDKVKQGSVTSTIAIQEVCEAWRLRGNQAYKNGDLSKAEDSYTRGIESVPSSEIPSCLQPLVICYSNRAATRMSLGNMREALKDCAMASALDPGFLKVQMRAANCHLALGELENAQNYFNKCLESGAVVCLDRRITLEAADGLQKSQKLAKHLNQSAELLDRRTSDAAHSALDVIAEALLISPFSERLLEMKAESMFMLQRYEEVIKLCEQTLHAAEKNFTSSATNDQCVNKDGSQTESCSFARLWRWHLISKSYFYLGRLEAALDMLEKLERMGSINDKYANNILESSVSLVVTIRALFHHKSAGNEAVRSGRYAEALEHYTAAISSSIESRPFAAICFCNRAAAHQALSQISDAIADCSLAIALDGNYSKAVSRRATLHEMIRDYGQAANDLQRFISVLENTTGGKGRQSGVPSKSTSSTKELRQAHRRLSLMEEKAKKGMPLDLYLILGVKQSDLAADIKKAYRKAALRHHPDKAGQFLARSESGDEGRIWKDIVQEVHKDADRLFKMIGEAYAVLSDPTKRSEYDLDEEFRKASNENSGDHPHRRPSDSHSYPYGRNDHRRNWQHTWKTYGHSHSRW